MVILISVVCIALLLMVLEIIRENAYFQVTHYIASSPKIHLPDGRKIIFLSDLHNQIYDEDNNKLLEAVRNESPDLILIGGDMLIGINGYSYESALRFVGRLPKICPVYYANGNHEQRMKECPGEYELSYADYRKELKEAGVIFLENETRSIDWDGVKVHLTGLEIPMSCYKHLKKHGLNQREIEARIGTCDEPGYHILLAHNPLYMEAYKKWGADLILSGHLHGGVVRIPGVAGVIAPNLTLFPRYSGGIYIEGEQRIVVSKGLGTHTIRVRLFNKAEVISLKIKGR